MRLFVTLIRFDEVYVVHFKTNKKMIKDYPNISNVRLRRVCALGSLFLTVLCILQYVRDLYQYTPIGRSVNMQHIRLHYYGSHTHLNAFGIVPVGPGIDHNAPHDRARFGNAEFPPLPENIK